MDIKRPTGYGVQLAFGFGGGVLGALVVDVLLSFFVWHRSVALFDLVVIAGGVILYLFSTELGKLISRSGS
jgi:hypothetical protein